MKIIEAMKRIKSNQEKITDLQKKIAENSANISVETLLYGTPQNTQAKIKEWTQACHDIGLDNIKMLIQIQKTNLVTPVTITLGDVNITKSIAEWIWRRREYATIDLKTWSYMTDRGLKEKQLAPTTPGAEPTKVTIVRHYDVNLRDKNIAVYKSEPHEIDAALEVINATTELVD